MATKIICIVDNEAKAGTDLIGEHGLSFWIKTDNHSILFDTGQTEEVLSHNLRSLDLKVQDLDTLVLSHAHYDHTGGLEAVLLERDKIKVFAHTDLFTPRYSLRNGVYKFIGIAIGQKELSQRTILTLSDEPIQLTPNLWTTGAISERSEPLGSSANLYVKHKDSWYPDPYYDDLSLVLNTEKGLVLICGCCHAGILNTMNHVEKVFKGSLLSVIGGMHLVSSDDPYLDYIIDVFNNCYPQTSFYPNHCTGKNAFMKLKNSLGQRVMACPAGTVISYG